MIIENKGGIMDEIIVSKNKEGYWQPEQNNLQFYSKELAMKFFNEIGYELVVSAPDFMRFKKKWKIKEK